MSEIITKSQVYGLEDDLNKQNVINDLDAIRSGASLGATSYQKPQTGIPSSDLSSAVQTSLGKADTALQTHQDISGKADVGNVYTKNEVDSIIGDLGIKSEETSAVYYTEEEVKEYNNNLDGAWSYGKTDTETWEYNVNSVEKISKWTRYQDGSGTFEVLSITNNIAEIKILSYQTDYASGSDCSVNPGEIYHIEYPLNGYRDENNVGQSGKKLLDTNNEEIARNTSTVPYNLYFTGVQLTEAKEYTNEEIDEHNASLDSAISTNTIKIPAEGVVYYNSVSEVLNDKSNISDLSNIAFSGSYNDLINKPTIPTVPTNVSELTNDAGYLTSHQDISGKANISDVYTKQQTYSKSEIDDKIGDLGNQTEATYYTQEEANAYNIEHNLNEGDEGFITTETIKTEAVPYNNVKDYIHSKTEAVRIQIPNDISDLNNNVGYLTAESTVITNKQNKINDLSSIRINAQNGASIYSKISEEKLDFSDIKPVTLNGNVMNIGQAIEELADGTNSLEQELRIEANNITPTSTTNKQIVILQADGLIELDDFNNLNTSDYTVNTLSNDLNLIIAKVNYNGTEVLKCIKYIYTEPGEVYYERILRLLFDPNEIEQVYVKYKDLYFIPNRLDGSSNGLELVENPLKSEVNKLQFNKDLANLELSKLTNNVGDYIIDVNDVNIVLDSNNINLNGTQIDFTYDETNGYSVESYSQDIIDSLVIVKYNGEYYLTRKSYQYYDIIPGYYDRTNDKNITVYIRYNGMLFTTEQNTGKLQPAVAKQYPVNIGDDSVVSQPPTQESLLHYVVSTGKLYISVGTSSVDDWKTIN